LRDFVSSKAFAKAGLGDLYGFQSWRQAPKKNHPEMTQDGDEAVLGRWDGLM
tara:strand:+ start:4045 stop:4200 length:156 start_codon:yes stop_codon:yes gene_type:complete